MPDPLPGDSSASGQTKPVDLSSFGLKPEAPSAPAKPVDLSSFGLKPDDPIHATPKRAEDLPSQETFDASHKDAVKGSVWQRMLDAGKQFVSDTQKPGLGAAEPGIGERTVRPYSDAAESAVDALAEPFQPAPGVPQVTRAVKGAIHKGGELVGSAMDFVTSPLGLVTAPLAAAGGVIGRLTQAGLASAMVPPAIEGAKTFAQDPTPENFGSAAVGIGAAALPIAHEAVTALRGRARVAEPSPVVKAAESARAGAETMAPEGAPDLARFGLKADAAASPAPEDFGLKPEVQNPNRRVTGSADIPLNDQGRADAQELAQKNAGLFDRIEHSPMDRAAETAEIVAAANPRAEVGTDAGLGPWKLGEHEGQPIETEKDAIHDRARTAPDEPPPGRGAQSTEDGEPFNDFRDRVVEHLKDQITDLKPGERVLNVTHGRDLRAVDAWLGNGAPEDNSVHLDRMTADTDQPMAGELFHVQRDGLKPVENAAEPGIYYAGHGATDWNTDNPLNPRSPLDASVENTVVSDKTNPLNPSQRDPLAGTIGQLPADQIKLDPTRFQYKSNVGQRGVSDKFSDVTKFDPELGGMVSVWRDPADGETYGVNGHHRVELAQRVGYKDPIPVRYLDAVNAQDARTKGALINIAEDHGSAVDAAKVFRDGGYDEGGLKKLGITLKGEKASQGFALANLDPSIFSKVVSGDMPVERAALIGRGVTEHADQKALQALLTERERSGKRVSNDQLGEMIRLTNAAPKVSETQESLFGSHEMTRSLIPEKADVSDYVKQRLGQEKKLFAAAGTERAAEQLGSHGNVIKADENAKVAERTGQAQALYDKLSTSTGAVNDALDRAATAIADGENHNAAKAKAYDEIKAALLDQAYRLSGEGAPHDQRPAGNGGGGADQARAGQQDRAGDPGRIDQLRSSIAEGELSLRTGTVDGRKLRLGERDAIQASVARSKVKLIDELQAQLDGFAKAREAAGVSQAGGGERVEAYRNPKAAAEADRVSRMTDDRLAILAEHGNESIRALVKEEIARRKQSAAAPPLAGEADPEYQSRIDAERVTRELATKNPKRMDGGEQEMEDSPLFGGPRQGDMFGPDKSGERGSVNLNTLTGGGARFIEKDIVPIVKRVAGDLVEAKDQALRMVAPQLRGEAAEYTALSLRQRMAQFARRYDQGIERLKAARDFFNGRTAQQNYDFIDQVEHGLGRGKTGPLDEIARPLARMLDQRRREVQALGEGKLENFYTNYFGHVFERPEQASKFFESFFAGKRSMEGPKSFLQHREFPTFKEAIEAGMKPVSDNPVDLAMMKVREMDRYLLAHEVLRDMEQRGIAKRLSLADAPDPRQGSLEAGEPGEELIRKQDLPANFIRIADPIGGGKWYAEQGAADVLNNYLTPGLRARSGAYRIAVGINNVMNQANLGLSAFHLTGEVIRSSVSRAALGIEDLINAKPVRGMLRIATSPAAPVLDYMHGSKVLHDWFKPGSEGAPIAAITDSLAAGGGRVRMDAAFRTNATSSMRQALREGNFPGAVIRAPFALLEQISRPMMENLIPRLKLGVFHGMAADAIERLGPGAGVDQVRKEMAPIWDSVDNRMGQVVYDNLFWNRTMKDLSHLMVRSVGWNLGTIREIGGGALALKNPMRWRDPAVLHKVAYTLALPLISGMIGALYQYARTGKGPEELKDYFFPKRDNGQRVAMPTDVKDVYHYATDPVRTLENKTSPLVNSVMNMLHNRDYYDRPIRNADDPFMKQLQQEADFAGRQFLPFTLQPRAGKKQAVESTHDQVERFLGVTPASKDLQDGKKRKLAKSPY